VAAVELVFDIKSGLANQEIAKIATMNDIGRLLIKNRSVNISIGSKEYELIPYIAF